MISKLNRQYPYIGRCDKTGTVVAFVSLSTGVCIATNDPYDDSIGESSVSWYEEAFTRLTSIRGCIDPGDK